MARTLRWWRIRQWFERRGRLYLYLVLTMLVVAYVVVPWTVAFIQSLSGYNPNYYEPRDPEREEYLSTQTASAESFYGWESAVKLVLLVLVGLLWLIAVSATPWGGARPFRR